MSDADKTSDIAVELAKRPDGLVLNDVWCFTQTAEPAGLEVTEVELLPPENSNG